jgi:nicotinic acid mononucleotide adenylyltransferase
MVHHETMTDPTSPSTAERTGVYPGSFNPPTVAHLAIADAARRQRALDRVFLVISRRALAKEHTEHPRFEHRVEVVTASVAHLDWLDVIVTEQQLLVDIADGHDVLVMGADKWAQINDPAWYRNSIRQRDRAMARLPELAIAPRPPIGVPPEHLLEIPGDYHEVSSTLARLGALDLMTPAARTFAERTGAWIDPDRYERTTA